MGKKDYGEEVVHGCHRKGKKYAKTSCTMENYSLKINVIKRTKLGKI